MTFKLVGELYYYDGGLRSRHALKLRYASQKAPRAVGPLEHPDRFDTASGLDRGLKEGGDVMEAWASDPIGQMTRIEQAHRATSLAPLPSQCLKLVLETQPRLDVRALARGGLLDRGEVRIGHIDWEDGPVGDLTFYVDLANTERPHLGMEYRTTEGIVRQKIWLVLPPEGSRGRIRFRCPTNYDKVVEVLAYRDGRFASKQAQRMINRSQAGRRLSTEPTTLSRSADLPRLVGFAPSALAELRKPRHAGRSGSLIGDLALAETFWPIVSRAWWPGP